METTSAFKLADMIFKKTNNDKFKVVEHGQFGSKVLAENISFGEASNLIGEKPWKRQLSFE